jgi:CRISPR/Cas system CSM-associated protein Csm2 small subunit
MVSGNKSGALLLTMFRLTAARLRTVYHEARDKRRPRWQWKDWVIRLDEAAALYAP